jgi:predicted nucleic acid-binding protein
VSKNKLSNIVAIDSQTLIWGVRKEGNAEQLQRAQWLFEELSNIRNCQVLISSIVIAEYLVPADKKAHPAIIESINQRFLVKPFDVQCSSLAADLFRRGKPMRPNGVPMGREVLRADTLIIATAKVHRAQIFYSGDVDCRALAGTIMEARDLPLNSPNLFSPRK